MNQANHNQYSWLEQDSLAVAPLLLGWELISRTNDTETGGRIVEVEAYHGSADPASHAYRGLTPRTAPMFEAGGTIYVYLSHGIHNCINIVTGPEGEGQAVLIRALEPTMGMDQMAKRRKTANPLNLSSGPGKLAQALGIGLGSSGTHLGEYLSLRPLVTHTDPAQISASPRVGISKAVDYHWRFYLKHNPFVSRA